MPEPRGANNPRNARGALSTTVVGARPEEIMKALKLALVLAAVPLVAAAQDAVKVDPGHYKVLIDNPSVRVLKITYAPGAKSPMHSHPDSMLVALGAAKALFTLPDGKTQDMEIGKETASYTPATTHAPANVGTTPVDAILVEFKAKDPGTASVPTSRPGMQLATLAEEGQPTVTHWKRGDVQFIGRGVKHESKNTSGKPIEFAIVAIK